MGVLVCNSLIIDKVENLSNIYWLSRSLLWNACSSILPILLLGYLSFPDSVVSGIDIDFEGKKKKNTTFPAAIKEENEWINEKNNW